LTWVARRTVGDAPAVT